MMPDQLVIHDGNYMEFCEGGTYAAGSFGCVPAQFRARAAGALTFESLGIPEYHENEWQSRIRDKDAAKSWLKDLTYKQESLNQGNRGQCHIYGNCGAMRTLATKQGGVPRCPSAQALAYYTWNGRSWGNSGADPRDSFECLMSIGAARAPLWPMDGDGQSSRFNTQAAKDDCLNMKLVRGVQLSSGQRGLSQLVSCALNNIPCAAWWDWWGHHTEQACYLAWDGGLLLGGRNSWSTDWGDRGFYLLAGSKRFPTGALAFVEMTYAR